MNDLIELLPCPFCGGTDVGREHVSTYSLDSSYETFGCRSCWAVFVDGSAKEWNRRARATTAQAAEIEALRAKTAMTMGVGTGDGKLFVHGDYESIKAAQEIVLERDALRAEVERWKSASLAQSGYAHAGEKRAADAEARAERLAEALREIEAIEDEMEGGDWDEIETARKIARAALHPTSAQADETDLLPAAGGAFFNEVTPC